MILTVATVGKFAVTAESDYVTQLILTPELSLVDFHLQKTLGDCLVAFQKTVEERMKDNNHRFHTKFRKEIVTLCKEKRTVADAMNNFRLVGARMAD